jgi:hypothetical protein
LVLNQAAGNLRDGRAAWRKSGWNTFDPSSKPYVAEDIREEWQLYSAGMRQAIKPAGSPTGFHVSRQGWHTQQNPSAVRCVSKANISYAARQRSAEWSR